MCLLVSFDCTRSFLSDLDHSTQGGMGPGVILAPQIAPPDYCGMAWFACLFCFWPTGICAILKSNEVRHNGYFRIAKGIVKSD